MRIRLNDGTYAVSLREAEEDGLYESAYDRFCVDQSYADYCIFDYPVTMLDGLGFEIPPKSLVWMVNPASVTFEATYRYVKGWRKSSLADELKTYSRAMFEYLEVLEALQRKYFYSLILRIGVSHLSLGVSFGYAEVEHTDQFELKDWKDICSVFEDVCRGIADEMQKEMVSSLEAINSEEYFRELIEQGELWITDSGKYIWHIEDYVDG